ncbi:FAD:protein FMN transferase [Treponema pedis]|uniref:FAD:protein FMN transferase n=1 Tax=Treponema pedis TaxID=409322 RepID=UPI003133F8D9
MSSQKFKPFYAVLILFFAVLFFFVLFFSHYPQELKEYAKTDAVLGTVCRVRLLTEKPEKEAHEILNSVFTELFRLESLFNANSDIQHTNQYEISELEKVNRLAGIEPVEVSEELYSLVKTSIFFAEKTDGAFNPAIGPLVKLWNIGFNEAETAYPDKQNGDVELIPSKEKIEAVLPLLDYRDIILSENGSQHKTIFLRKKGMRLDLGGIAKGYAADKAALLIVSAGIKNALIDLGGNISVIGKNPSNKNWKIGIKNPNLGKNNSIMNMEVTDRSLVTSGNYERYFIREGILYHHILDSKTGYPVKNDLNAVSILCKKSVYADVLSTACFVLGREKSQRLLNELEKPEYEAEAFFFFKDNTVSHLSDLKNENFKFEITDKEFKENTF